MEEKSCAGKISCADKKIPYLDAKINKMLNAKLIKKGVIKINFGKKIISNSYNSIEELTQQTRQEVIKLQNEIL